MPQVPPLPLESTVRWGEVVTSTELVGRFKDQHRVSPTAARKRLERFADSDRVWRSTEVVLPRNNRLFALLSFTKDREFHSKVAKVLEETRPGLARCLREIGRRGLIHDTEARKLLAAPAAPGGAFPGFERDLAALRELGVTVHRSGSHQYLGREGLGMDATRPSHLITGVLDSLRREGLLARVLVSRLRKQNLLSWNGSTLPGGDQLGVEFNDQMFSGFGFSYLKPLVRQWEGKSTPTPCPVLIDVYSGGCELHHVHSFTHRAERAILRRGKENRYLGVIAARSFAEDAWNSARGRGLMAINLVQMFGDEALEAMAIAERLLGGFQVEPVTQDFTALLTSIKKLRTNPVVVDLYSIGFEAFTGLALRDEGCDDVTLNTIVPFGNTKRDVDAHGRLRDDLVVVECKAYHKSKEVTPEEVKKFFTETVPSFVRWWSARNENRQPNRVRAEIWTTGKCGRDAISRLAELKLKSSVDARLRDRAYLEKNLSFEIKSRMGQFLSAIAEGGEQDEAE